MGSWFDRHSGWAAPYGQSTDYAALARELGHRDPKQNCLGRRQGVCPGLDLCHDCPWAEGTEREDDGR
jgi:hypothetical protein